MTTEAYTTTALPTDQAPASVRLREALTLPVSTTDDAVMSELRNLDDTGWCWHVAD